ncbi:hypothetical protein VB264_06200 [Arcicella aquatica]|uniref:GH26 domain-containing protein n=1 Tax=Arcicella aquatica TaxID=217141 RepID=A0ABU5QJX1_9BACT|nr:hypothetical protein [Arcicella aquatica]MEA5257366.1 hypothetical protein [Arcicella aquatica]
MIKKRTQYLYSTILIVLLFFVGFIFAKPYLKAILIDELSDRHHEPILGVYDRFHQAGMLNADNIEHYTITWKNSAVWFDANALELQLNKGNPLLLTIETWSKNSITTTVNDNVIDETIGGKYDDKIEKLGHVLSKYQQLIFIRWNPNMELPVYQYPWQFQSPEAYINAFNYFAKQIKRYAPNVKIVWGPSGYPGDTEYWVGDPNVDFVSLTLDDSYKSYTADTIAFNGYDTMTQKMHRMRFINKPVLILGSDKINKANFHQTWISQAAANIEKYKNTVYSTDNFEIWGNKPLRMGKPLLGIYDPKERLLTDTSIKAEHLFVDLGDLQSGKFEIEFKQVLARHHDVIVTMEPWRDTTGMVDNKVLTSITNGRYDKEIAKLYAIITKAEQTVYLRWLHEMEIPIHRYLWQSQKPVEYINAYRYFMLFNKKPAKNIRKVWGPAGDRGSADWWPGNDVVDYISFAIYGLPDKNITDHNKQERFEAIFNRKNYRMRFLNKPIFITEFGVKGPEDFQTDWMNEAAETINANKQVFGMSYFNLYDNPKVWGKIKAPDWSITNNTFDSFYKKLR